MAYEPLVTTGFFDGVKADVLTASTGWLAVVAALAGALLIIKVLTK